MNPSNLPSSEPPSWAQLGTVFANQANFYWVHLTEPGTCTRLLCTSRARLKKTGQSVLVGDRVLVEEIDWVEGRGAIAEILPRQTEMQRPPIANANCLLLVFPFTEPPLDPWQLSRFLVTAEITALVPYLALNKSDLISTSEREHWRARLQAWGYTPTCISVQQGDGIATLQALLAQKIVAIAGPSGAGKSSLINCLIPTARLRVGAVSGKLQRGRHTTRHVELFSLPAGGWLADSPGFNKPSLDCDPAELAQYFPEARARLAHGLCQFSNCLHRQEPNCVVRGDWERYSHYLQFLDEAIARHQSRQQAADADAALKLKIKQAGTQHYEPRLERKKYRRPSRRQHHQQLQDLYDDMKQDE
ncbi:MAG: small ribosomal subunit biogenesis GTPase RsgA [Spirulinaceae cyanobacterium SM2_1_0]|nr:small ribosomal subunit biogenesis GTPase RsgA [Spirulinaceae cyanobacterium SM2_1_0]